MRRAQLLTLDAMLSLIIVIFILAAVTNTSSALKEEISSMIEWQERANIAENMLDVLTKSPGEPSNWYLDPGSVKVVGLRSSNKTYALDYRKLMALNSSINELVSGLTHLSQGKDFMLETFVSRYNVTVSDDGNLPVVNYTSAPVFESTGNPTYSFAVINGTVVTDQSVINSSMNRSPWIEVEKRIVTVERFEYNLSASPSKSNPMIYGTLENSLPTGAYFKVTVPDSDSQGNMSFVIVSGAETRGLMIYKNTSIIEAKLIYGNTTKYTGNKTSITIPLKEVLDNPQPGDTIGIWLYSISDSWRNKVAIEFVPIKWALEPRFDVSIIKLWVWDDS